MNETTLTSAAKVLMINNFINGLNKVVESKTEPFYMREAANSLIDELLGILNKMEEKGV